MKTVVDKQREYFKTNLTKSYQFRLSALKKLKENIVKNEAKINEALFLDLNKSEGESYLTEVGMVLKELSFHIKNLKKQMKIKKVKTPLALFPAKSYTYFEPLGSVLVIAPWNYPFL